MNLYIHLIYTYLFLGVFYSVFGNVIIWAKCTFDQNTAILGMRFHFDDLGGVAYILHDSSLKMTNSIFDDNWAMLYPLFYLAHTKYSESSCTLWDINTNIIPSDAANILKTKLTGYSSLQSLVDSYSIKEDDAAAIKLENGYIKISTSKTISQDYFISAISDSVVYIESLEYLSPTAASTIVNCQSSFLSISNTTLKSLQVDEEGKDKSYYF